MNPLLALPNLRYVGGAVGHRLDIYADRIKSSRIRISLSQPGTLALEQVVIYGREITPLQVEAPLVDLTALRTSTATQSTIRVDDNQTLEQSVAMYGPHIAHNGIINGYDRAETQHENSPYWEIALSEPHEIETIHVSNFCARSHFNGASFLLIEYLSAANSWTCIYNRSAQNILDMKFANTLANISRAIHLEPKSREQLELKEKVCAIPEALTSISLGAPNPLPPLAISELLLNCVDAFTKFSLEPGGRTFQFNQIPATSKIDVVFRHSETYHPTIKFKPAGTRSFVTSTQIRSIEFSTPTALDELIIEFPTGQHAHLANCFKITTITLNNENQETPYTLYDNAAQTDICNGLAWAAFLAGNDSARAIGLISKTRLLTRRPAELQEAYLWSRLNLHGRSPEYMKHVEEILKSATIYDYKETRLSFGRHAFSTTLADRNQQSYISSIEEALKLLNNHGFHSMLLYGTLLGAVRNNSFIPHDDDVDLGYLSHECGIESVTRERELVMALFRAHGWLVGDLTGHTHLTFSVARADDAENWVEFFPIWHEEPNARNLRMYMDLMTIQDVDSSIIGDATEYALVEINGKQFPAPAAPEAFLKRRYGPNWQTPDQFFEI